MLQECLRINWDKECERSIRRNTGYIVTDLNNPLDIPSNVMKGYSDGEFIDWYRCE